MNEQGFVDKKQADWTTLSVLCDRAEVSVNRLTTEEMRLLIRLYRNASTDLALARTKSTNSSLIFYLNDLVGRSYAILYRAPRKPFWGTLVKALQTAAQTVRRNRAFVFVSALIFFGSAFFIYGVLDWAPQTREQVIPEAMDKLFDSWRKGEFEDRSSSESSMMTGFYASNNPRASVITGAVGAGSFGVISVYLLYQNGAMLGALSHEMSKVGKLPFLLSSIAPHGVPELSGIIVSGSVGLMLAYAVINPRQRRRSDALRAVGKDAIVLLATSVVLMFIAAPIEAFFSFQPTIAQWFKAMVAGLSLLAWLSFWIGFGREAQPTN